MTTECDSFPDRVLAGPVFSRHALVDENPKRRFEVIRVGEKAPAAQGYSDRTKVIRRRGMIPGVRLVVGIHRAALHREPRVFAITGPGHIRRSARRPNTR